MHEPVAAQLRARDEHEPSVGHRKGAYTDAASDRGGLLRTAHQGVLFLDEIGEPALDAQAMLLDAVEEKRFLPMGSDKEVGSDFELMVGTNRDRRVGVAQARFREDLLAQINLWAYTLPGLAQRPEDIEPNVDRLLARAACAIRPRSTVQRRSQGPLPAVGQVRRSFVARQHPRPDGQRDTHGHAGR